MKTKTGDYIPPLRLAKVQHIDTINYRLLTPTVVLLRVRSGVDARTSVATLSWRKAGSHLTDAHSRGLVRYPCSGCYMHLDRQLSVA